MSLAVRPQGMSKANEPKELIVNIDEQISGKDIVLARVETDKGNMDNYVYSRTNHSMSMKQIIRTLNPKAFIRIILTKKVGISNVEPEKI